MPDAVQLSADEEQARQRFHDEYPDRPPAELAVVIAAYNEEANVGGVLEQMPEEVLGLQTVTIVVDDGSADKTYEAAKRYPRALVAQLPRNRGQGVALRLGYALSRDLGVKYIATTDADGQYPPTDLHIVLKPILDDKADFVTGSRKLGGAESPTLIRRLGTIVFARLVSVLSGQAITDTSNTLRAMPRRDHREGHPRPTPVPVGRAADRRAGRGLARGRGSHRHPPTRVGQEQEGPGLAVRLPLRHGGGGHVAAGAPPPQAGLTRFSSITVRRLEVRAHVSDADAFH